MKIKWELDLGLQGRMLFTMFLLAVVYLFFLAFLSYYVRNQDSGPKSSDFCIS
jgi:heat shock protein HtpX